MGLVNPVETAANKMGRVPRAPKNEPLHDKARKKFLYGRTTIDDEGPLDSEAGSMQGVQTSDDQHA